MPQKSLAALAVIGAFAGIDGAFAQQITRVTLYPGSATIERTAQVNAGIGKVELTGLPATFDPRTLRVETDAGIQIGEVAVKDVSRSEALSAREAELEARIQRLKDEKAALDVDVKTAELARDYLASLSARPDGEKGHRAAFDPKALEAIRRGGADAYGVIQRTEIKKRELDKRIAALQGDLGRVRNGARDVRTVAITYSAARAGALRAAYQVSNAGWKPQYRAALDSGTSRVELERQAAITQRTGEDWRGVTLRLSTGAPRSAQIVDPNTWQLVIRPPVALESRAANAELRAEYALARADKPAAQRAPASEPAPVAEFQTEYTTEFEVPGKVDLAADGRQITVSLAHQQIPVKQRVRVVPRRDTAALVTAEADLPEGVWIPGDVQLYRDGGYVGSTYWQAQAKERLVLPFGRDDRVQVAMKRLKDRKGAAGIIGQRAEREVATLYTVTSRHKVPVELLLLEAAPVPVDDKISVDTAFEPKPKSANWEERRGVYAWEQPLAPGQTLKFVADYTITYPKDAVVLGLP
ncbi:MAG TPA: DUF4139 domain-containing protein [Burkholderiales bacterium]|nr:DUF4139 domain-containing protein [Burkholderiales bacterium]